MKYFCSCCKNELAAFIHWEGMFSGDQKTSLCDNGSGLSICGVVSNATSALCSIENSLPSLLCPFLSKKWVQWKFYTLIAGKSIWFESKWMVPLSLSLLEYLIVSNHPQNDAKLSRILLSCSVPQVYASSNAFTCLTSLPVSLVWFILIPFVLKCSWHMHLCCLYLVLEVACGIFCQLESTALSENHIIPGDSLSLFHMKQYFISTLAQL